MSATNALEREKQIIRERTWERLERHGAVDRGVAGHIPAFVGGELAADRLTKMPQWQSAKILKANPDRAQLPVRASALEAGKTVYMAVPNMATLQPFYLLDPNRLPQPASQAAAHQTAATLAPTVAAEDIPHIDLVVCGSVTVNMDGARIGKGAGYSDIELALLIEAGAVDARTTIMTTVHQLQIVEDDLPEAPYDFRVDAIVTADKIVSCRSQRRPNGILPDYLTKDKIAKIPAVAALGRLPGHVAIPPGVMSDPSR